MIDDNIKIHDQYQFEIKFDYSLTEGKKPSTYDIETYIFIPNSLGINRYTYKKEDFYNDIQSYIRFKTPTVLLRNLVSGKDNPLSSLKKNYENVVEEQTNHNISLYDYHTKMFCCILKSSLRDHVDFIRSSRIEGDISELVADYIFEAEKITTEFRKLRMIVNVPGLNEDLFSIYLYGDEYISHLIEMYSHELIEIIKRKEFPGCGNCEKKLLELVKKEISHRKINNYPSIPEEETDNEELLFRRSVLKKFMESILFLSTQNTGSGKLLEQLLFGIAAGLAMLFATSISFYTQSKYGSYSMPFFMIIVIAYIFKDRIKELLRVYFSKTMTNILYDHKFNIYTGPDDKIGYSKASFDFIKENRVPERVKKLRNRDHITEIENGWMGEKILLYRRNLKIFSKKFKRVYRTFKIDGINDIIRFNIFKYLQKMDDPNKHLYTLKKDGHIKISGQRVYHLNMVMKYTADRESTYKRFRIVLNRAGIKRIEEVDIDKVKE